MLHETMDKYSRNTNELFKASFGKSKEEDILELYKRAANISVRLENWEDAGKAIEKIASIHKINSNSFEAIENFMEASNYYGNVNIPKAILCRLNASEIQLDNGDVDLAIETVRKIQI
jgi:hypothetical protein